MKRAGSQKRKREFGELPHLFLRAATGTLCLAWLLGLGFSVPDSGGLAATAPFAAQLGGDLPGPLPLFPASNWWNLDISAAPVDPRSREFIEFINNGASRRLHPDFGGNVSADSIETYGIPYIVVGGDQSRVAVTFEYADESDGVDRSTGNGIPYYPIPEEAVTQPYWIEGGPPGNIDHRNRSDRHMILVDRDNRLLYELYHVFYDGEGWHAGSGARFDLKTNTRRPDGWTSADAAGLAILPGLVRYDEVYGTGEILHAFRVTVRATNGFVYPASHRAGASAQALPLGARLRLRSDRDLTGFRPEIQRIFRAMKRFGLIVADNGSDMYVTGTYDRRWDNEILNPAFHSLNAGDFEVVQLGYVGTEAIYLAQVVLGGGFESIFTLVNTGSQTATGALTLTARDGTQTLGQHAPDPSSPTAYPIRMVPGASQTIMIPAVSESPSVGWARIESTGGSVSGYATYRYAEGGGLRTAVAVAATRPMESAAIPLDDDASAGRYTGFAVANPLDLDLRIRLLFVDENGIVVQTLSPEELNPLGPHRQVARFFHEYPAAGRPLRGSVVLQSIAGHPFVAVALVENQGLYTAIPVVGNNVSAVPK